MSTGIIDEKKSWSFLTRLVLSWFQITLPETSEMAPLSRPTSAPDSLKFVQNALAKTEYDEDLDITPLATSVHKNQPTTRSSTVITTATSKNPMMIPNSYSVPDETYTKRVFDRFISLLKQVHFLMLTGISKWYC